MAEYVQQTNNALTPKLWSKRLSIEALRATWVYKFMGEDDDSLLQIKTDLSKAPGDTLTYGLRMQPQGDGVIGDATLEGDEEALNFYSDAIIINQLRHAHKVTGRMTQQRSLYDLRNECFGSLRDWWAGRMDESFFNQICGYTPQTFVGRTGLQLPTAPDAAHYISAHSAAVGDENITSTDVFSLSLLDKAKERARTLQPTGSGTTFGVPMRPIRIKGDEWYVCFLHPYQVTDLRTSSVAAGSWVDYQKAAMTGGLVKDNPIFDGALGVYNGIVLHEAQRITPGVNSSTSTTSISTVRRAVFCGAQAAQLAFGRNSGAEKMDWNEETFDYGNQLGVEAGSIFGIKKTTFGVSPTSGSLDFGTIVLSSYAAAHS